MDINHIDLSKDDRRNSALNNIALWSELNMAQQAAANILYQYGFQLSFIRSSVADNVAGLLLGDKIATINSAGDIDTDPEISIRS